MSAEVHYDRKRLIAPGETLTLGFDLTDRLAEDETLVSITTAIAESPLSDDVTLGAGSVNDAAFADDDGAAVAIGKGVQVQVTIAAAAQDADYQLAGFASTSEGDTVGLFGGIKVRG